MEDNKVFNEHIGGISTKVIMIPLLLIVAILHIIMVMLIIDASHSNNNLSDLMKKSGEYQIDATSMMASNTVLSETSNGFIQSPVAPDSSTNFGPLITYVAELDSDRRSPKVAERFQGYDVNYSVKLYVSKASELSEQLVVIQMHAISVMTTVYSLPPIPAFSVFSNYTLTQEEQSMTPEERVAYAKSLILNSEYAQKRFYISENIENCNKVIQQTFADEQEKTEKHVGFLRDLLWVSGAAVITILLIGYFSIYFLIVRPLGGYAKDISLNQSIKHPGRIIEMKRLAKSFNGLWEYRNKQETILRTEAENDALTGLPNRHCLERDLLKTDFNGRFFAVLMFDVNFLKRTNDTRGHLAGDNLIRTAAMCIRECFNINENNNCYRVGGDEFIVLMLDCKKDEIKRRIEKFNLTLEREDVSISVGYAYADKEDNKSFNDLMEEADKNMYKNKKRIHDSSN